MKKEILVFNKRFLILALSTVIVFTSVFNSYKIAANATSFVIGGITYTVSEVLAWLGATVLGITGISFIASDDYSKLIEIGYEAAKAMDAELDNTQEWLFATMDKDGAAYFYANNYFDAIQTCDIESIISSSAELSNDFAIFATDALWNLLFDLGADIEAKVAAGEETFIETVLSPEDFSSTFDGFVKNEQGNYVYSASCFTEYVGGKTYSWKLVSDYKDYNYPQCLIFDSTTSDAGSKYVVYAFINETLTSAASSVNLLGDYYTDGVKTGSENSLNSFNSGTIYKNNEPYIVCGFNTSLPVFGSLAAAQYAFYNNDFSEVLGVSNTYQIADWSDTPQHGDVQDVITKNPALVGDYVGGMLNAFGTSVREQALAGEFPDVIDTSIGANPFDKPDVITTSYVGELDVPWDPDVPAVDYPGIADSDLPWTNTWAGTDVSNPDVNPEEPSDDDPEEPIDANFDPKDKFGLNTIFGILILLIMIIIMLLMIFISCLAFIVNIFRIEATTGFLPDDMVAGFEYLKTLEIPGFGMSVYSFFMALIYFLLFFSIVGILRTNIDKIKFPRKGGKKKK